VSLPIILHWIIQDLLAVAVGFVFGRIIATKRFSKFLDNQAKVADSLDTNTPGGLTDVVNMIASIRTIETGENLDGS
jgi:hypothetical protein